MRTMLITRGTDGMGAAPPEAASVITFSDVSFLESSGGERMTNDTVRGSSDRSILVLTSLADWPKHGYALIKDIEGFAGVRLGPGTLYSALAKLEQAGLVEALPAEDRRRPYRITAAGLAFLYERLTESARIAEIGLRRIAVASS
jgi:DNA-binding PadR family transcriptional regulator